MTKIRTGFVTNSSSSSFVLLKKDLTDEQYEKVMNHIEYAQLMNLQACGFYCGEGDGWDLKETADKIEGSTSMNNFDMEVFFGMIGITNGYKFETDG